MLGQFTMALSTSPGVMTIRLGRIAEMFWVMIHHETVMCGWNVSPCLWPGAGTAWPPSTTSSTPLEAVMTTKTPQSALTSCMWSPMTHTVASGLRWHHCCCLTARRGLQSGQGGSMCSGATAGRAWRSPEPRRYTTLTRAYGPEGQTCRNPLQGLQHVCALWNHREHHHLQRRRWDKGGKQYFTPHSKSDEGLSLKKNKKQKNKAFFLAKTNLIHI